MSEPFGPPATRDITVRKHYDGAWIAGCADCWIFYVRDTWEGAMERAQWHLVERHQEATA